MLASWLESNVALFFFLASSFLELRMYGRIYTGCFRISKKYLRVVFQHIETIQKKKICVLSDLVIRVITDLILNKFFSFIFVRDSRNDLHTSEHKIGEFLPMAIFFHFIDLHSSNEKIMAVIYSSIHF